MKGNPMKLGSIASKSVMKLKDKVMKMKKEAAMKMKKESMAKMKEAMTKMKKDPMMMKKGSPMEMKKGEPMKIKGPTKPAVPSAGKALPKKPSVVEDTGPKRVKRETGPKRVKSKPPKDLFKERVRKEMSGPSPIPKKMNMVKGPDGKMVPDFAVDGKGANDMKKSPAKKANYSKEAKNLLKAVPNKEAYDKLSDENKKRFDIAAKKAGLPTMKV